jgi:hypothetical protein
MDVYQRRRLVALSILAVVFIVLVLLIRSCGGDDDAAPVAPLGTTGTEGATALTLAAYIDQADASCLEANSTLASVDETDPVAAATERQQILAGELESLQSLPVPEDAPSGLQDLFAALEDQVSGYGRLATALERGDDTAAAELQTRIDEAATEAQDAASQVGLDVCGDLSQVGEGGEGGEGEAASETGAATEAPPVPETGGVTTTTPAPAPAPVAPTEGGVAPPAPAPAPAPTDGGDSGSGSGSGGVSP